MDWYPVSQRNGKIKDKNSKLWNPALEVLKCWITSLILHFDFLIPYKQKKADLVGIGLF